MSPSILPALPTDGPVAGPVISIIIPHLNQPELLRACLQALRAQHFNKDSIEIIVVDNGSRTSLEAVTRDFPEVVIAYETAPGPGPARNRGAAISRAPLLAFTDADCRPDPCWLAAIAARFTADPGLAILGGQVQLVSDTPGRPTAAEAFEMLFAFRQKLQIARHGFSATANLATRRTVLDAVGPFAGIDTSEDLDWGRRAAQLGFRTEFVPEAVVAHPARRSMAELRAKWARHIGHFYHLRRAEPGGRLKWALSIPLIALSPLADLPAVLTSPKVAGVRLRALAFAGLIQIRLYRAWAMLAILVAGGPAATACGRWNRP